MTTPTINLDFLSKLAILAIMNHWYVTHSLSVSFDRETGSILKIHPPDSLLIDWSQIREADFLGRHPVFS